MQVIDEKNYSKSLSNNFIFKNSFYLTLFSMFKYFSEDNKREVKERERDTLEILLIILINFEL